MTRLYLKHDGTITTIVLEICHCEDRRGPANGVCGNCGKAIPKEKG
jgi:hypothetical protein